MEIYFKELFTAELREDCSTNLTSESPKELFFVAKNGMVRKQNGREEKEKKEREEKNDWREIMERKLSEKERNEVK